jgi:hypothetical protein
MPGPRPNSSRTKTIWGAMVAIALIASTLALAVNEAWRWGYPRRVPFVRETALVWLERVVHQDFGMYDDHEVDLLLAYIEGEGLLLGKTRTEVLDLLGPPDADGDAVPLPLWADRGEILYVVGTANAPSRAQLPTLNCHFGADGKCDKLSLSVSD